MEETETGSDFSDYGSSQGMELDPSRYESKLLHLYATHSYCGLDKGFVDGNGQPTSHSSIEYLNAIMHDLDILAEVVWSEPLHDKESYGLWHTRLYDVLREVDRLMQRPTLIEIPEVRDTFFQYVENFCGAFEDNQSFPPPKDLVQEINMKLRKTHLASYDSKRVPWHQFLHHYAPGSNSTGLGRNSVEVLGIRQTVPPAGLKLIRGWEQDFDEMQNAIYPENASGTEPSLTKSAPDKEHALGGTVRYRLMGSILDGPSFFTERVDPNYQSLESLTRDLARWDVHVEEAPNPDEPSFMYVSECTEDQWYRWRALSYTKDNKSPAHPF